LNTVHDIVSKFNKESENFDTLIMAIENNISNDIIFKIMEEYLSIHKSFDYFIEKEYYNDGYSCLQNTPLFIAIAKNNFEIASYLLMFETAIYNEINIIKYLYFENYLYYENFQYILSRKLVIDNKRERDYIINKWIRESKNEYLELYIKGFFVENNIEIEYDYYEKALDYENYNATLILFNYDKNGNYNIFKLVSINIKDFNEYKMLDLLSKCEIKNNFKNENFYNSKFINELNSYKSKNSKNSITEATEKSLNYYDTDTNFKNRYNKLCKDRALYINESTYESLKSRILELYKLYESWNPERDLPNQEDIEEFKEYIVKNKETIIKFNEVSYNFDLLIYTIENNYPLEIIKYIINNFNYKSFDYGLEGKDIYAKTPKYRTPLFEALSNENFELTDFLLDKGATLNKVNTIKFLMSEGYLKPNVIIYLFLKDYNVSEKEDSYYMINTWIEQRYNIILEMYLNYFNIKNIRREYYYMAIEKKNIDALIILYGYDRRPKDTILEEIFNILDINDFYYDEAKKIILDSKQEFQEDKCYYNIFQKYKDINKKIYEKLKYDLNIDKEKYITFGKEIKEFLKKKNSIFENKIQFTRECGIFNDLDEFKRYFKYQDIKINEFNDPYFDILIYLIERIYKSNEIIEYVIDQYRQNNIDFNYFIEYNDYDDDSVYNYNNQKYKKTYYKTPLICDIIEEKFSISDLLIKNGANINFNIDNMEPFFINFINCSKQQIKYFIDNKYKMPKHLLKWCIKEELNPSFINTIYNNYYNNSFIIELIFNGKNKIPLSDIQLKEKILFDNEIFDLAIENHGDSYLLNLKMDQFLKENL